MKVYFALFQLITFEFLKDINFSINIIYALYSEALYVKSQNLLFVFMFCQNNTSYKISWVTYV